MASQKVLMKFKKGDGRFHYFQIEGDAWSPGGTLFFTAKSKPDDDSADAAAVIDKSFTDSAIVGPGHEEYLAGWVTYELEFLPEDIKNVSFADGTTKKTFKGEYQFILPGTPPNSFPDDDSYIEVVIYADIKRGVA